MRSVRGSKGKGTTLVEERGLTDITDLAPRRMSHLATFTKIELVIRFMPGSGGVGAVVHSFLHAAHTHEQIVHIVEEKWRLSDELSKKYKKMNKLYRNLDAFYYVSNKNPAELDMYEEMKPRMTGSLESRLQSASDSRMKADLIAEDNAFKELEVRCERLIALRAELSKMKQIRDTCQLESVTALEDLNYSKSQEILAANKVSQDHMLAIQRKISLHELYANIHIGYILIRINDQEVEHLPFQQIMKVIKFSSSPHNAEFQRYDSIYDPAKGRWTHLSEQRAKKMYIADPIIKCREFFAMVRAGDIRAVQRELAEGTDPNTVDDTLTSALHVAAVSNHPEIVKELVDAGARLESRDANMSTALLSSVKRGLLSMCQLLLDLGAVKMVSDRTFRSSSYFAAKSGCIELVRLFVDRSNCNAADNLWCSTPMHIGAERGDERLISYLLQLDASIYALDKVIC